MVTRSIRLGMAGAAMLVMAGVFVLSANAQQRANEASVTQPTAEGQAGTKPMGQDGQMPMCPMCMQMMAGEKAGQSMMGRCMMMMRKMGMSDEMIKRMDAMMKTPIFLDSPCAVYGQASRLGLSDEQKRQLVDIENDARKKTLAVLTPEQRQTLGDLPETPMPMMKMCETMRAQMREKMGEGGHPPMMRKMMDGQESTGSSESATTQPGE